MMNVILIIQIVAMVLELIVKGLSESETVRKASRTFNVSESFKGGKFSERVY